MSHDKGQTPSNGGAISRRQAFAALGGALLAGYGVKAFADGDAAPEKPKWKWSKDEHFKLWKGKAGEPYQRPAPGVCKLPGPNRKFKFPDPDKYKDTTLVHGMCQLCSTICGITGIVKDDRIIKIEGNYNDPNSRGKLCARGHAGLNHMYHPERLLYPLRRVGKRGEGKWKRISWDEAYTELAARLKKVRDSGKPENFAFHQGRSRSGDAVNRFLSAFGTPSFFNHRALCSAARRTANQTGLFESDWDLGDYENAKYVLNFGSNMFEAHQGHIAGAQRIQNGRFDGGKLVTFDVRMSNTGGNSDEFFMPHPGTDGAIALAMGHVILTEKLYDEEFLTHWVHGSIEELKANYADFTPEWAEKLSGVPAKDIARIAREFAAAAPRATTMCNRGSSAHINGFYNDRAIQALNGLVGSVGKVGGYCWMWTGGVDKKRFKPPKGPKKPKKTTDMDDPPEFVLANAWAKMRVGEIVYHYLQQGRGPKFEVYMTYNLDSPLTWPEIGMVENSLLDEKLIEFHVCINPFYNETAHYADMVLPWTTYMERWDVDARGAYNLKPYLSMRRPMVTPLGEAKDIREIFPELGRRIGGGMEEWFPADMSVEDYMIHWTKDVPYNAAVYESPMEMLEDVGAYEDPNQPQFYEPYMQPLSAEAMEGATVEEGTGVILNAAGKGIGIMHKGKPVRGFKTPSRKLEIKSEYVKMMAAGEDVSELVKRANHSRGRVRPEAHKVHKYEVSEFPTYMQIEEHVELADDQLIMTSFKWNVHNHGRTANLKWCSEIVHCNPAWIHPDTAKKLGLKNGDWIEITGYRSKTIDKMAPALKLGTGKSGTLRLPVVIKRGVHPRAIAISNSLGHTQYTRVAQARKDDPLGSKSEGMDPVGLRDEDWERNMWWEDESGGDHTKWKRNTGPGWAQNKVLAVAPDVISGQQAFHDTVVTVKKLS